MNLLKNPTLVFTLALTVLASSCASYKDADETVQQAELPTVSATLATDEQFTAQAPVAEWWQQLQDAELNQLIDRALVENRDIRAAQASLQASRALLRNSKQQLLPSVEVGVSGVRQNQVGNPLMGNNEVISETYQGGYDVNWEADLFGRLGSEAKVAAAQAQISEADLQAAQVSIAAEVASAYIALRGAQYQLQVAQNNTGNQQETFDLTQRLAEIGRGDQFDIARAQAQLALTQASIPSLQADVTVAINRLSVLSNQPVEELRAALAQPRALPSLPTAVAIGSPAELLQRRPDVRRADYALRGAVAGYNVRVADLYPRITFSGSLGYLSSDWGSLGEQSGNFFAFAPSITWAGLNVGRVRSQIDAADARIDARVAEFEQSVALALEETDNALQRFSREEERRLQLLAANQASTQAADFARQRFEIGTNDFLSVLDAQRSQLDVSAQLAQSETQLLLNLVEVYKALGGGWAQQ
ncbi:MAG: efflux transporter outer membrane subunit [Pseudomonadota bacterium]